MNSLLETISNQYKISYYKTNFRNAYGTDYRDKNSCPIDHQIITDVSICDKPIFWCFEVLSAFVISSHSNLPFNGMESFGEG